MQVKEAGQAVSIPENMSVIYLNFRHSLLHHEANIAAVKPIKNPKMGTAMTKRNAMTEAKKQSPTHTVHPRIV